MVEVNENGEVSYSIRFGDDTVILVLRVDEYR